MGWKQWATWARIQGSLPIGHLALQAQGLWHSPPGISQHAGHFSEHILSCSDLCYKSWEASWGDGKIIMVVIATTMAEATRIGCFLCSILF